MIAEALAERFGRSHRSRRATLSVAAYRCAFGAEDDCDPTVGDTDDQ